MISEETDWVAMSRGKRKLRVVTVEGLQPSRRVTALRMVVLPIVKGPW